MLAAGVEGRILSGASKVAHVNEYVKRWGYNW